MTATLQAVGIGFGPVRPGRDGPGDFAQHLGRQLAALAPGLRERAGIELHFHLPARQHGRFGQDVRYLATHDLQRHLHLSRTRFALWHALRQDDSLLPPWRSRRFVQTLSSLEGLEAPTLSRRLARCDAIVALSDRVRAAAQGRVKGRTPVEVIGDGIRPMAGVPPVAIRPLEGRRFLLHVSRMRAEHNIAALIELARVWPQEHFVLAGPQSDDSVHVGFQIESRGLENVHLLQDVRSGQLAWLYAHCSAFLYPALAEDFRAPILAALQFGKPVFLSSQGALPEYGGDVAMYFDEISATGMRQRIEAGLAAWSPGEGGLRARDLASRHSIERCAQAHLALYQRLLAP